MSYLLVLPDDSFIPFDGVSYTRQATVDYIFASIIFSINNRSLHLSYHLQDGLMK